MTTTTAPKILDATTAAYRLALSAARTESARIADATSKPEEMPTDARYYLSDDFRSGFGITTEGTLIGLFSLESGRGSVLMTSALLDGVSNLDCFDGFLPEYYARFGFRVTDRVANWTPGLPDVVFMALDARVASRM